MDEGMKGWMEEWRNGGRDEWMNGRRDGWMKGRMDAERPSTHPARGRTKRPFAADRTPKAPLGALMSISYQGIPFTAVIR